LQGLFNADRVSARRQGMIKRPSLRGMTTEQAIATLDTWVAETADELNYVLSHLDKSNMIDDFVTKDEVNKMMKGEQ
jgi:hypothetical protein